MQDNLSIVITMIVLVTLIVIFPLYNFFERQDNMSYNLVLKATTNFVDGVKNNGYIDQTSYDNFVMQLGNTGNVYDVQIEAHKKTLIKDGNEYIEKYKVDYNDDIFVPFASSNVASVDTSKRTLKANTYLLNKDDQIYVKVKNINTTMAGALFSTIVPTVQKTRLSVNCGGIIKNNSWKQVDSEFFATSTAPTKPILTANPDIIANNVIVPDIGGGKSITFTAKSINSNWWKTTSKYVWTIQNESNPEKTIETTVDNLTYKFNNGSNSVKVYTVDSAGEKSDVSAVAFLLMNNFKEQAISSVGLATVESIQITNATISEYTFKVVVSSGHYGADWWRVTGLTKDGIWENLNPGGAIDSKNSATNGVNITKSVLPDDKYVKLKFEYRIQDGHEHCLKSNSSISYSVKYKF